MENLRNSFGANRTVVGGLCFTCINRTSPTTVESLLAGYVQFGQLGQCLTNGQNLWLIPLIMLELR